MVKTMSKNDLISCFCGSECSYQKCGMYEQTLDICAIEHLKHVVIQQAGEQVNPMRNQPTQEQRQAAKTPSRAESAPEGMTTGIIWKVKGGDDAAPNSPMAFAFVHKYDAAKKIATDEVKADVAELVTYLIENKRYSDGIYDYTLSKDGNFLNRYPHKKA